jgi:hypothetical protein
MRRSSSGEENGVNSKQTVITTALTAPPIHPPESKIIEDPNKDNTNDSDENKEQSQTQQQQQQQHKDQSDRYSVLSDEAPISTTATNNHLPTANLAAATTSTGD